MYYLSTSFYSTQSIQSTEHTYHGIHLHQKNFLHKAKKYYDPSQLHEILE